MIFFRAYSLYFAWVISLVGVLLSLFYSEIMQYEPCKLCWLQRVALFPLTLQLGIAAYRADEKIASYAIPLCVFGLAVALFQSALPWIDMHSVCGEKNCTEAVLELFGTIPFSWLSGAGFVSIIILVSLSKKPSTI